MAGTGWTVEPDRTWLRSARKSKRLHDGRRQKPANGLAFIVVFEQLGRQFLIPLFAPIRLGKREKRIAAGMGCLAQQLFRFPSAGRLAGRLLPIGHSVHPS